ncbi:2Fe-2S iron-sulfur cluster-binding protein [Streptomyces sp. NPDC050704]
MLVVRPDVRSLIRPDDETYSTQAVKRTHAGVSRGCGHGGCASCFT